jgi:hypothetical protein
MQTNSKKLYTTQMEYDGTAIIGQLDWHSLTLYTLGITDYRYKRCIQYGNSWHEGVIAICRYEYYCHVSYTKIILWLN